MILMHIQKKIYIAIKNCIGSTAVEMLAIQLCVKNDIGPDKKTKAGEKLQITLKPIDCTFDNLGNKNRHHD